MKSKLFINHIAFRILAPIITGTLVYILILLVFDSLSQLADNFFSREVLFVIIITFALFELLRSSSGYINKKLPVTANMRNSVVVLFSVNILLSLITVSAFVLYYFKFKLGYTLFTTELITFNALFLLITILYTSLYLGIGILFQKNEDELNKELSMIESIEYELGSFKKEINPELLFCSLETLISLVHTDIDKADVFLNRFSKIYRYILNNKKQEFVSLNQEIENLQNLLYLQNVRFNGQIRFSNSINKNQLTKNIIPCTLQALTENAINNNIINQLQPMQIVCYLESDILVLKNTYNPRLKTTKVDNHFSTIKKSYVFYTNKNIEKRVTEDGWYEIKIPLPEKIS